MTTLIRSTPAFSTRQWILLAASRTQSIAWCTLAHIIHNVLGLGALAYAAWLGD